MLCNECFFYDLKNKGCSERHNLPAEEEKCYFFEPQVEVSLNQAEILAILGMFISVRDIVDPAQNSFYDKIRKTISPKAAVQESKPEDCFLH
jgi:hypothetical protein